MNTNKYHSDMVSEFNKLPVEDRYEKIPRRIFLDTNVLQYINEFGEFIFEYADPIEGHLLDSKGGKILADSFLYNQIKCLREIVTPVTRVPFEFAIGQSVILEVQKKSDSRLNNYVSALWENWQAVIEEYDGYTYEGIGEQIASEMDKDSSIKGAFSPNDLKVIQEAVKLECNAVLTCDRYRNRQKWIYHRYSLMILYPTDFLEIIRDFKALWR